MDSEIGARGEAMQRLDCFVELVCVKLCFLLCELVDDVSKPALCRRGWAGG